MSAGDIASYWPFSQLPASASQVLSNAALRFELEPKRWLFHQGDMADALFVLVRGELDLYQGDPLCWRKRIESGACIGELPLVIGGNRRRTASIRAVSRCELMVLRYADIRRLLPRKVFDSLLEPVSQRHLERLELGLAKMLGKLPLELLVEVDATMIPRRLAAGEVLFEQGDPLEHVWIVDEGRLEVLVRVSSEPDPLELRRVAEIGRGQPVGELAVLVGGERSATVRAMRDTWLRGLSAATFEALLLGHPGAALGLAKTLASRLVHANEAPVIVRRPHCIALVPVDGQVEVDTLGEGLAECLDSPTVVANAASFAAHAPGRGGGGGLGGLDDQPARRSFGEWLSTLESHYDAIVLVLGPQVDAWSRACVEAADELVLVARPESSTQLSAHERALAELPVSPPALSLVLLREAERELVSDQVFQPWLELRPQLLYLHQVSLEDRRELLQLGRGMFGT